MSHVLILPQSRFRQLSFGLRLSASIFAARQAAAKDCLVQGPRVRVSAPPGYQLRGTLPAAKKELGPDAWWPVEHAVAFKGPNQKAWKACQHAADQDEVRLMGALAGWMQVA